MSYWPNTYNLTRSMITDGTGRTASTDAFERLRTSQPYTVFNSKQVYDGNPLLFVSDTTGSGSVDHIANRSASELTTTTASGDEAIFQSRRYLNYQPGKSMMVLQTFCMESLDTNCRKRVGYFDENDGIFLEADGEDIYLVRRTSTSGSPVEERVAQADWNRNKLLGGSANPFKLDLTKVQILVIDFQWLGVGAVRVGFDIDGTYVPVHQFDHANVLTDVYMKTPNLPVRFEITNTDTTAGANKLTAICTSVVSEGGVEALGVERSASRGVTGISVGNAGFVPVIGIRLESTYNRATVKPTVADILSPGNAGDLIWAVILNPTFSAATESWVAAGPVVEYDISASGTVTGQDAVIAQGYLGTAAGQTTALKESLITLASNFAGTADRLYLCARKLTAGTTTVYGAWNWLEVA